MGAPLNIPVATVRAAHARYWNGLSLGKLSQELRISPQVLKRRWVLLELPIKTTHFTKPKPTEAALEAQRASARADAELRRQTKRDVREMDRKRRLRLMAEGARP